MLKPKIMKTRKIQTRLQLEKGDVSLKFQKNSKNYVKKTEKIKNIYLATKGAGLLGKTEWTDDEDEEEESVAENAPALAVDNTPASEEAPVVTENQAEENQEAEKEAPEANENVEISDEPIQEAKESQPVGNSPETEPAQ